MKLRTLLALSILSTGALSCSSDDEADHASSSQEPKKATLVGAAGVTINQVAIYQGVKRTLMQDGAVVPAAVPLVAGRDALIRIFFTTDAAYDGAELTAQLAIDGFDPVVAKGLPGAASNDGDLTSTFNFFITGDHVGESLSYSVALLQEGKAAEDNLAARWPGEGNDVVAVEGKKNTLRVILAPFAYNADGSGRVPDTSPEQVERYRQRFLGMYPVSNVEVTVREATPWSGKLSANGDGWQELGFTLYGFRQKDGTPDDTYYYGLFDPAASFNQYCGGGCLLGVTLLNNDPPETGSVALRLALGVGFPEYALDTAAHETGHAHGRQHSPCGPPGNAPAQIDPQFPYKNGAIGVWGYDIVNDVLKDPAVFTDIMGYCDNQWISDYTYSALFKRGVAVNAPSWHGPTDAPAEYELVMIDGQGNPTWKPPVSERRVFTGAGVQGSIVAANGAKVPVTGHYYRYDHLPGGWLFFPRSDGATRAEFVLDGVTTVAKR